LSPSTMLALSRCTRSGIAFVATPWS
jgi:hypothetical protein